MNRITRMLTMTGLGVVTALTMAGPAMAATSTGQGATQTSSSAQEQRRDRDRVVGVYRSLRECQFAGRIGERFGKWDDYDCEPRGFRRWVLEVSYDRFDGGPWGHGRPGSWDHGRPHHGFPFPHRPRR